MMTNQDLLKGKKVLIADDESDILESLEELLPMCVTERASTFEEAKLLLETEHFDIAILDIMGIDGYKLLEIANNAKVLSVMLTAHAFSVKDTIKSYRKGASYYVPKEEISNIASYLEDVLRSKKKGKISWYDWLVRLGPLYSRKFGENWQEDNKEFWEKFKGLGKY